MTASEVTISCKMLLQARFALEDSVLSEMIDAVISKAAGERDKNAMDAISELSQIAKDRSVGAILPFRLNSLDLDVATVLLKGMPAKGSEGIIFGEDSVVNAGFVIIRNNQFEYCDFWVEASRTDPQKSPSIGVRLIPGNRNVFQKAIHQLGDYQPIAKAAGGEHTAILLQGIDLASNAEEFRRHTPVCHLLDPFAVSPQRTIFFGLRIDVAADQRALRVTPTAPEAVIKLSASHHQKRWMALTCGRFQAVFAVPDISEEGSAVPAWVLHLVSDDNYVFTRHRADIHVPIELAIKCCETLRWFVIPDDWEMARRLSATTADNLGISP